MGVSSWTHCKGVCVYRLEQSLSHRCPGFVPIVATVVTVLATIGFCVVTVVTVNSEFSNIFTSYGR